MRIAGFLLLASGWAIVAAALILLNASGPRTAFALAGIALQVLGLILAVRAHRVMESEKD